MEKKKSRHNAHVAYVYNYMTKFGSATSNQAIICTARVMRDETRNEQNSTEDRQNINYGEKHTPEYHTEVAEVYCR